MIPTTCFPAVSSEWLGDGETVKFLSEIKERLDLRPRVLLKQVVG